MDTMMDSYEDQNYFCVSFLSENISIVNMYLRVYYKDPNEKILVHFLHSLKINWNKSSIFMDFLYIKLVSNYNWSPLGKICIATLNVN